MVKAYDVRKLPEAGDDLDETLPHAWLEEQFSDLGPEAFGLTPAGEGHATIRLRTVAGASLDLPAVRVTGRVRAPFRVECVRCLSPLERPLEAELELVLFPEVVSEEAPPAKGPGAEKPAKGKVEKVELSVRDLDEGSYRGFELDLPGIIREALLLELDMNPACEDSVCCEARVEALVAGTALEAGEEPQKDPIDPRWAPLQKFRLKSS